MLTYKKYDNINFTIFIGKDTITIKEWLRILKKYDKSGPLKYELFDLRAVESTYSSDEIRKIAELSDPEIRPIGSKTVILVIKEIQYGLSKIYTALESVIGVNWKTEVFYSLKEAKKWLGIDLSSVKEITE